MRLQPQKTATSSRDMTAAEAAALGSLMSSKSSTLVVHKAIRKVDSEAQRSITPANAEQDSPIKIWVGNLGNEVTDEVLAAAFGHFQSFRTAKVILERPNGRSKGYGFVFFEDSKDMLRAIKDMHNKFVGTKPCVVKRASLK